MTKEYSPFTPGVPVPPEFFIGRNEELRQIISRMNRATKLQMIERLFVMGERGIGKSSLCQMAMRAVEHECKALGLYVYLGGVTTLEEMAKRIFEKLLQSSIDKPWYDKIRQYLGDHIKQVGLLGITLEFKATERELSQTVNDFAPVLRNLMKELSSERAGIMLVLDDLNGLVSLERFANWLKSLVDELATGSQRIPIVLILVGLPERRRQLLEKQPSLDRVFDLINIQRFSEDETKDFYRNAFGSVNITIDEEALNTIWRFSGGFPVFMHELGDGAFYFDNDNHIDVRDAMDGIMRGTRIIGEKYIEPKVLAAIRSDKYKAILNRIAERPIGHHFTRRDIASELSVSEVKVFDNFLKRMRELGAIHVDKTQQPPQYRFATQSYHLYFFMEAMKARSRG